MNGLGLGIYWENLARWKREYKRDAKDAFPGMGKLKPEDEELRKLKKEIEDLQQEKDILKKALAIFSEPQR